MDRFNRNEKFFGADGQKKIQKLHVLVAGGGGLGQHVIQQLAFLGAGRITVIDDEELSKSNLNRYVLAYQSDPVPGTKKVAIAKRGVELIDKSITVETIFATLRSPEGFEALAKADVIFGCLDNDGARMILSEYSLAYGKTYFDLASDINTDNGLRYGGRIFVTDERQGCLICSGEIDSAEAQKDLADRAAQKDRETLYGVNKSALDEGGPSVVSVNGVIASVAVTEFIAFATELRKSKKLINYNGHLGNMSVNKDEPNKFCYFCNVVKGSGIKAGVERYLL